MLMPKKNFLLIIALSLMSQGLLAKNFIIKFKSAPESDQLGLLSSQGVENLENMQVSFGHFYTVQIDNPNESFLSILESDPNIEYIEEDREIVLSPIREHFDVLEGLRRIRKRVQPNDPLFPKQWGLVNDGQNGTSTKVVGKAGEDINVLKAWANFNPQKVIRISVIDTGVDYNHPDLKDNILVNQAELDGEEGVDDDNNGYVDDVYGYDFSGKTDSDPIDENGHGTHCAGIIAASHNDIGISGVIPKAEILPVQFLSRSGRGSYSGAVKAIDYSIKRGVHIMSNSWGGGGSSATLKLAITRAEKAGILFVAAAGNNGRDIDKRPIYPGGYDHKNILTVGSYQADGKRSSFSNYGKKRVDVFAPGSAILSTFPNDSYKSLSGTSMATPMVSGIAALLWSQEPKLSVANLKKRLIKATKRAKTMKDLSVSGGKIDAYKALRKNRWFSFFR